MNIYINRKLGTLLNEIFVFGGDDSCQIRTFLTVKDGQLQATRFTYEDSMATDIVKPMFTVQEGDLGEMIEAFMQLGSQRGIEKPSEAKNAGKLEATEKHLEDMRTLVFNEKK